jgi:Nucleoside-diphosphate-sugar epimerases
MNKTLYLLTGAAGNLGSSIARQLVAEGREVRALVLKGDLAAERVPPEAEVLVGDIVDKDSLVHFFTDDQGRDLIVIHCASIVTVSPEYSKKVYEVNVNGTKNVVDLCLEKKVKKLVYISSTGAIRELPKKQAIVEVDDYDPDAVVGFYGQTKAEATRIVLDAVRYRGLDASVVCPSGIAGPGDYAYGPVASFIIDYVKGGMPAGVAGSFNAADVRDLAAGTIACCDKGRKGESYILGNDCVSMGEMFHLVSEASGAAEVKTVLPVWVARVMAAFAGLAGKVTGKKPKLTTFSIYNLARNNEFSSAKAEKELGYRSRPFSETLCDTVAWLRLEGKI